MRVRRRVLKSRRDSGAVDELMRSKPEAFHRAFCPGARLFVQWKVRALRHVLTSAQSETSGPYEQ